MVDWSSALPILIAFAVGYLLIIFEEKVRINKTASALVTAVICWLLLFVEMPGSRAAHVESLEHHVSSVSEIVFFLLAAMAIVELIDSHHGFRLITQLIGTRKRRHLLWIVSGLSFFLSAALDNLTTTIVMISLLRKLLPVREERLLLGGAVVVCANAGGVWTPIGDVTTTMLWIANRISTGPTIAWLFVPSFTAMLAYCALAVRKVKGVIPAKAHHDPAPIEPGASVILPLGIASLVSIPVFRAFTGLPPYMGALIGLGALWMVTDFIHHPHDDRAHLRIPHVLSRIDTPGVLFFLGILLSVSALETTGLLSALATWINSAFPDPAAIAGLVGLASAIVDNVPLVAATIAMYPLELKAIDQPFWQLIALCAGTGGSILSIGSAAGVAFMGLEKVSFMWYMRKVSVAALISFVVGLVCYLALREMSA